MADADKAQLEVAQADPQVVQADQANQPQIAPCSVLKDASNHVKALFSILDSRPHAPAEAKAFLLNNDNYPNEHKQALSLDEAKIFAFKVTKLVGSIDSCIFKTNGYDKLKKTAAFLPGRAGSIGVPL